MPGGHKGSGFNFCNSCLTDSERVLILPLSQEARELYWERLVERMLSYHDKNQQDIDSGSKSATWKVMIAHYMKRHTAVTNGWLSQNLNMGVLHGVSRYVAAFEQKKQHRHRDYKRMIATIKP